MSKRRSPQEKKRLSYSKDRRNWYGENDKSSRKNIARRKQARLRTDRRRARQQLADVIGRVDEQAGERVASTRPDQWRKVADVQLGVRVAGALARRARTGISAAGTERARIDKIRRSTSLDGTVHRDSRWWRFRWPG